MEVQNAIGYIELAATFGAIILSVAGAYWSIVRRIEKNEARITINENNVADVAKGLGMHESACVSSQKETTLAIHQLTNKISNLVGFLQGSGQLSIKDGSIK